MKEPRYPTTVFVKLDDVPGAYTRELGPQGARLVTSKRPDVGSVHEVSVLWDDVTVRVVGRIQAHTDDGVDVQFEEATGRFKHALAALLEEVATKLR